MYKVEFDLLDAPYHASLIAADAMAKGLRGTMRVMSKWRIEFVVSEHHHAHGNGHLVQPCWHG